MKKEIYRKIAKTIKDMDKNIDKLDLLEQEYHSKFADFLDNYNTNLYNLEFLLSDFCNESK